MSRQSAFVSPSAETTREAGACLGSQLQPGDIVLLHGDLGAGKTTFTQGLLRALAVAQPVNSPTFVLVGDYQGTLPSGESVAICHADLFRLTDPDELESFGYFDLIDDPAVITIIEWPERAGDHLPERYLLVTLEFAEQDARRLTFDDRRGSGRSLSFELD